MRDYKRAKDFYDYIIKNNGYRDMTMIWTISCVEDSLQAYDMDLITSDDEKETICNLVLNNWLDTEHNIGISKISDLVIENWYDLKDSDSVDEDIQELINDEVGF